MMPYEENLYHEKEIWFKRVLGFILKLSQQINIRREY